MQLISGKLNLLNHNEFTGFNPFDMSMLLRGDVFVLVDCCLTYTYANPSKDITIVNEFFANVMEMGVK